MIVKTPELGRLQTASTSLDLISLSEALRDHLPRELREMIYESILDAAAIKELYSCAFHIGDTPSKALPAFIIPRSIDETIRGELVRQFCKLNTCLEVNHLSDLGHMLRRELFYTQNCLGEHKMRALTVQLSFLATPRDYLQKEAELCAHLTELAQGKLTDDFVLTLMVQTSCFLVAAAFPFDVVEAGIWRMITCLREMYALFRTVKAHVGRLKTRRKAVLAIRVESRGRNHHEVNSGVMTNVDFEVREEMLRWDARTWFEQVVPLL